MSYLYNNKRIEKSILYMKDIKKKKIESVNKSIIEAKKPIRRIPICLMNFAWYQPRVWRYIFFELWIRSPLGGLFINISSSWHQSKSPVTQQAMPRKIHRKEVNGVS